MKHLVEFKPVFIEGMRRFELERFLRKLMILLEPTNPDDVLGHATIRKALKPYGVGVATGEAAQNRVTFKQLLQAEATDVCQIDAVRLGSVNECLVHMTSKTSYC
jgi:L-galactonate dehydratase